MFNKERKPDTLKQKRTRQYVRILLGLYLLYTAYNMGRDLKIGIVADSPMMVLVVVALFAVFGVVLCVTAFIKAMKISAEEIKENEKVSEETDYALTEYDRVEREVNISAETEEGEKGEQ